MIAKMSGVKHDRAALFMGLQDSLKASAMQLYVRILCLELLGKHIFREGASGIVEHLIGNLQFSHLRDIGVNQLEIIHNPLAIPEHAAQKTAQAGANAAIAHPVGHQPHRAEKGHNGQIFELLAQCSALFASFSHCRHELGLAFHDTTHIFQHLQ